MARIPGKQQQLLQFKHIHTHARAVIRFHTHSNSSLILCHTHIQMPLILSHTSRESHVPPLTEKWKQIFVNELGRLREREKEKKPVFSNCVCICWMRCRCCRCCCCCSWAQTEVWVSITKRLARFVRSFASCQAWLGELLAARSPLRSRSLACSPVISLSLSVNMSRTLASRWYWWARRGVLLPVDEPTMLPALVAVAAGMAVAALLPPAALPSLSLLCTLQFCIGLALPTRCCCCCCWCCSWLITSWNAAAAASACTVSSGTVNSE